MECKNCELRQRQFYCASCLKTHVRDFRLQTQHFASDRDEHIAKGTKALTRIEVFRNDRATVSTLQDHLKDLGQGLEKLKRSNDSKRERLRLLREQLAARRRTLSAAKLLPSPPLDQTISKETQELHALSGAITRARIGLVQELIEVFNIVEVGGRPPIGGRAGTKGEWTIGDLILPVPGDIRRYPPDHINAVITHTIHFLGLLTFYLGVKLPFDIQWDQKRFAVGRPWIGAIKGTESGGWSKWSKKQPLHLSSSSTMPSSATALSSSTSESYIDANETASESSFTTAFAMLLYNVCYLAHTQSVEIPLSQAGDALSNLWGICCSPELGRRSHQTVPPLPPPTSSSFSLDFAQLLQATAAKPAARARIRPATWSPMVRSPRHPERIIEEDGWEMVDEAGEDAFS
ncbi:hypothetical protein CONPUDRAFT_133179 [Coniophora puteana RWD-64-598 SS2]|uniref:Autophagy-related protein 14 n=1 Tax=Coniophora puteana (strain RWD-64-598) TaxID=741705 RepID=R7SEA1_CONPW|nr:uncharacterized protein CONPUDRAFT_133179 [Coniophora puteana RWD-64-598 SS2]EIW74503.1 hypothetical protein CONPUDRAFT_133179 [Coniophora puteana RWD-64-598 SS2]